MPSNADMAASAPATMTSFLLELPGELRANIYKALFKDYRITIHTLKVRKETHAGHEYDFESNVSGSSSLAILSTCRGIRNEATKYLSSATILEFTGSACPHQPLASFVPPQYFQGLQLVLFRAFYWECINVLIGHFQNLPALRCVEIIDRGPRCLLGQVLNDQNELSAEDASAEVLAESYTLRDLIREKGGYSIFVHVQFIHLIDPTDDAITTGDTRLVSVRQRCQT